MGGGGVGLRVAAVVTAPIDLMKTRLQVSSPAAAEREGDTLPGFNDFHSEVSTRIWS